MKKEAAVHIPGMDDMEANEEQYFSDFNKDIIHANAEANVDSGLDILGKNEEESKKQFEKRIAHLRSIKLSDFKEVTATIDEDKPLVDWERGKKVINASNNKLTGEIVKTRVDGSLLVKLAGTSEPIIAWPLEWLPA